jgi:thiol-disulfide isomerase/thioredoxin
MKTMSLSMLAPALIALAASAAWADPPNLKTLPIGAKAPDFALPGVDGKTHALADFKDAKVLVVVFTCNPCPTAQAYEDRLLKFQAEYGKKGVALVAISPNDDKALRLDELGYTDLGDSFEDMKLRAKERGFTFPYLYDGDKQTTALAYGALATPHVFIFDKDRTLRYNGRFDDGEVRAVKSRDAINAVEALLAGTEVPVATTRVFGCSTKWSDKRHTVAESLAKWDAEPVEIKPVDVADVKKIAANDSDKLLLVNLWATWCGPCVQELDQLVEINRMYRGRKFEMVTISLDEPEQAALALKVLKEHKVAARNLHYTGDDRDALGSALDKDWPGPVPYTVLIAPGGKVLQRWSGTIEPLVVKRAIVDVLGRTYASRDR